MNAAQKAARLAEEQERTERRRKVAALYLRHVSQTEIAQRLGIAQATVSRDIAALTADYIEAIAQVHEVKAREMAELDLIERELALAFLDEQTLRPTDGTLRMRAIDSRIKLKERRARYLGLDAPLQQEIGGVGGGPIEVAVLSDDERARRVNSLLDIARARRDRAAALDGTAESGGADRGDDGGSAAGAVAGVDL